VQDRANPQPKCPTPAESPKKPNACATRDRDEGHLQDSHFPSTKDSSDCVFEEGSEPVSDEWYNDADDCSDKDSDKTSP
jgi:hypothetical protein